MLKIEIKNHNTHLDILQSLLFTMDDFDLHFTDATLSGDQESISFATFESLFNNGEMSEIPLNKQELFLKFGELKRLINQQKQTINNLNRRVSNIEANNAKRFADLFSRQCAMERIFDKRCNDLNRKITKMSKMIDMHDSACFEEKHDSPSSKDELPAVIKLKSMIKELTNELEQLNIKYTNPSEAPPKSQRHLSSVPEEDPMWYSESFTKRHRNY